VNKGMFAERRGEPLFPDPRRASPRPTVSAATTEKMLLVHRDHVGNVWSPSTVPSRKIVDFCARAAAEEHAHRTFEGQNPAAICLSRGKWRGAPTRAP
jgi:hypothetical protein